MESTTRHAPAWSPDSSQPTLSTDTSPLRKRESPDVISPTYAQTWGGRENIWAYDPRQAATLPQAGRGWPSARRVPMGEMQHNTLPALGLASPFLPASQDSVWGPVNPNATPQPLLPPQGIQDATAALEAELRLARIKIQELQLQNETLIQNEIRARLSAQRLTSISTTDLLSPPLSSASSMQFSDNMTYPSYSGQGLWNGPRMTPMTPLSPNGNSLMLFGEEEQALMPSESSKSTGGSDYASNDEAAVATPPGYILAAILRGTFNYTDMHPSDIRPIVWIIATRQPRNNVEVAALKTAVSNLANRFNLPRRSVGATSLINAIIEFAQDLCFTSCGNYLGQQLLERGDVEDKEKFIEVIQPRLVEIASDKFGTHVLCKAVGIKELEETISKTLLDFGIFESLKTGARRLWREYLDRSRQSKNLTIFHTINEAMKGKWADLACINEHGSIAVQQVFEVFGQNELKMPCYNEILADISRIANNQFGHFVITKLITDVEYAKAAGDAVLTAYPPVATTHHGVNFVKIALCHEFALHGKENMRKYIEAICSSDEGRTPGIVTIATSAVGKGHLTAFVLGGLQQQDQMRVRNVCRAYSTTLRNSQSGNDLLRTLGIIHASNSRHRLGGPI